tara:strand:+ start:529 stop:708 length:180 start_codon:yes stop_codon:yes gene_type:complete
MSKKIKTEIVKNNPRGLGDSIEKFTQATGIKKIVDTITKGDCGCNKRRDALNRAFPYSE